ncbi:MAG: hypothetical protein M3O71_15685 [Bacteroidota bacterium]|nr:hypothetical protein [Bacteroidota bacterium]
MARQEFKKSRSKLATSLQITARWIAHLFAFRPAAIDELATEQSLLFEGTTCRLAWRVRGAYRVKVLLNNQFYKSYPSRDVATLPVHSGFDIELIACSIYGNAKRALSIPVRCVYFKEAGQFLLNPIVEKRPQLTRSLYVRLAAGQPITPAPVFAPVPITLGNTLLNASRESLEQEIILNAYQSETNFQSYHAD